MSCSPTAITFFTIKSSIARWSHIRRFRPCLLRRFCARPAWRLGCATSLGVSGREAGPGIEGAAPCLVVVCEDDFNFLTKMCLSRNRELAFWTAQTARAHGCRVAVHGSDSTDHVQEYLNAGFDYVLIGEVEETLLELACG